MALQPAVVVLLQPAKPDHRADPLGQQQVVDHVEHQQRLHRIVRKPLAPFDHGEEAEPLGMAEKGAVVRGEVEFGRGFGGGQGDLRGTLFTRLLAVR